MPLATLGLENGLDFEKITSSRKAGNDRIHPEHMQLGYITLQNKLQNDESARGGLRIHLQWQSLQGR